MDEKHQEKSQSKPPKQTVSQRHCHGIHYGNTGDTAAGANLHLLFYRCNDL